MGAEIYISDSVDAAALVRRMGAGDANRVLGRIEPDGLRAEPGHRLRRQPAATADIGDAQARERAMAGRSPLSSSPLTRPVTEIAYIAVRAAAR